MQENKIEDAVREYTQMVLNIAYTYTKNSHDAEDIAQDVFLSLYRNMWKIGSDEYMKAWLIRVTINKSKNHMKTAWIRKRSEMPNVQQDLPTNETGDLLNAVLSLDVKYKIPIYLMYYEGYSIKEISEIVKIKPATIGTRLKRGREILKNLLGDDYFAE
ncbi:RNA polymerase sigma factor [Staphylococcus nepalensis]|uniref:RNA polymerase sigma factor n=1 Tax=Staphylococcus nepalensis TaxID=214473 RepID=UPI0024B9D205|nr:sigma-70 family RNA polymerase sigma factor [Staphylococcus nepalensis]